MRILIADDSATSRTALAEQVEPLGYDPVIAEDGNRAWRLLERGDAPCVAIVDWNMPGIDGLELCRRVRELDEARGRYTYMLLVTSRDSAEDLAAGLAAGADDFLAKPVDPIVLGARIRVGERMVGYAEQLHAANAELRRLTTTDTLTGVASRSAVMGAVDREFQRHQRDGSDLSVMMIDVDGFKQRNDGGGHDIGDRALQLVAERISAACRIYDTVGRVGGDEFLVVLPSTDEEGVAAVAERVRAGVEKASGADGLHTLGGGIAPLTVSIGIATHAAHEVGTPARIVRAADQALLRAKREGRNRVCPAGSIEYSSEASN